MEQAVLLLGRGGLVAYPTESWYGLAVDPFNREAVDRLFAVKRREKSKPLPTLISSYAQLVLLTRDVPVCYRVLMEKFWPGPLTLVFPAHPYVPACLTAGTDTVAVRLSSHPVAAGLAEAYGGPITATSANISGETPQDTAQGVVGCLGDEIDMVLDGGRTAGICASTVVSCPAGTLTCLREGRIAFAGVKEAVQEMKREGKISIDDESEERV
ncbi:MAG TPA: threonylcarbamoyl-AMP synthase [Desulfobulbaceae bacterium]|nr:threonylcarbamoyl-AMP synthase [Desulfobulbaceae bacterium]